MRERGDLSHFSVENTDAQRHEAICPRSQSQGAAEPRYKPLHRAARRCVMRPPRAAEPVVFVQEGEV